MGRPLPYGSIGVEPVPEEALGPDTTIATACRLMQQGRPFAAHEVCEAQWKAAPPAERDLWQGLAQLAVGLTHHARGNRTGARRLVDRGSARLTEYAEGGGPTYGLDLAAVRACAESRVS